MQLGDIHRTPKYERQRLRSLEMRARINELLDADTEVSAIPRLAGCALSTVEAVLKERRRAAQEVLAEPKQALRNPHLQARRAELIAALQRPKYVYLTDAECEEIARWAEDGRIRQSQWRGK